MALTLLLGGSMKTMSALVLLSLGVAGLAGADETNTLRQQARDRRDEAGAFSPEMGVQASHTMALGERALAGMKHPGRDGAMYHYQKDTAGVSRAWHLDLDRPDQTRTGRVTSVGPAFSNESVLERRMDIARDSTGKPYKITSVAHYNPRGSEGKSFEIETSETALRLGFHMTERAVRRRSIADGAVHTKVISSSRVLSLGALKIPLPKR